MNVASLFINRLALVLLVFPIQFGCKSKPVPLTQEVIPQPVAIPDPLVFVDDIPADAPAAIRAHLIKLREMRDQGRISPGDYESRKALLLQPR